VLVAEALEVAGLAGFFKGEEFSSRHALISFHLPFQVMRSVRDNEGLLAPTISRARLQ
jgi:hypothetical protein